MAQLWAYVVANWQEILLAVIAVDQVLIGIFPTVAIFGSLKDLIKRLLPPSA